MKCYILKFTNFKTVVKLNDFFRFAEKVYVTTQSMFHVHILTFWIGERLNETTGIFWKMNHIETDNNFAQWFNYPILLKRHLTLKCCLKYKISWIIHVINGI